MEGSRPERESRVSVPFQTNTTGRPERAPMPPSLQSQISASSSVGYAQSDYTLGDTRPSISPLAQQPTVSFGEDVRGDSYVNPSPAADVRRKKSLVRPERTRLDPDNRLWNYRNHAAAMQADGTGNIAFSNTGHYPQAGLDLPITQDVPQPKPHPTQPLRRGVSILARDAPTDGAAILRRGTTLRNRTGRVGRTEHLNSPEKPPKQPISPWMIYVNIFTCCCPAPLLSALCGYKSKERQLAFKEKCGVLGICAMLMAFVGFLTFGFTQSVCGDQKLRFQSGTIPSGSMIFHGWDYSMDRFQHPGAAGIEENSNPLYEGFNVGGMDGSFLFQIVNEKCIDIITPADGTGIPHEGNRMGWYFPCNFFNQYGSSDVNKTGYADGDLCHTQDSARSMFYNSNHAQQNGMRREGQVFYTWQQVRNESRNLGVFDGHVLDFDLLNWLDRSQVVYPELYDQLAIGNSTFKGQDITMQVMKTDDRTPIDCLVDVIRVGGIDADTIGCKASDVVLYASLIVILGVVVVKFGMAVFFGWFLSWKLGRYNKHESQAERQRRAEEIESWTNDIYRPAPAHFRPNARKSMLPTKSRFTSSAKLAPPKPQFQSPASARSSMYSKSTAAMMKSSPPDTPLRTSPSSLNFKSDSRQSSTSFDTYSNESTSCPLPLASVVPQPPSDFEPFGYNLIHSICLVTAYSESVEGLRTTLDSLATTDYPNSHKVLLVIADGIVKGSGNDLSTPEIVLTMMKEFLVPPDQVQGHSYVAIAHGHKRHNMAKVYAGFYEYDNNTVEPGKQQRVPMLLVAKSGNPLEANEAKPGNRGKRDSQVLLMNFLQKVMFDERMTTFEYEFFNAFWRVTGVCPELYQTCLMVDADTKVFPDALSRMNAVMVRDPEVMGLCGETKIANKTDSWVTMIQVFEYYLAHHQTKAFESVFGGVTCLPGCFSMYRIKTPKGDDNYWVPIIANPDIVEHYSENVVDTLHKKNLLLLGEDRYLSTLMLKTFPRRKMMFCPQAVCKTVVPDEFKVLLSQRRRWINSTVHNLFELLLVRDLCGTFCFSMQFVVFMDLVGTMVLPAAIAFTLYILAISCMPGKTKPTMSLILLAFILGLPGVLIVVTSRKIVYVGWMLVYLCSLPIWNFVFPFYSFLHMDDFSWGATRKIDGDKGGAHGDKEGEFDSSHIVMKRWAEFERERRWKAHAPPRVTAAEHLAQGDHVRSRPSLEYNNESRPPPSSAPFDYSGAYGRKVQMPAPLAPSNPSATTSSLQHQSSNEGVGQLGASVLVEGSRDYPAQAWQSGSEDSAAESRPMLTTSPDIGPTSPTATPSTSQTESDANASKRSSRYGGGVSLRDDGPVAAPQSGLRSVQRSSRASLSGNRVSKRSSSIPTLPPGARPNR